MANPENPYTMGGFLRSKLQSNEQSIKQTPNLSEQQSIVPSTELIDSGHHDEPSALGLIGASFSTYLKLLPQLPGAVISKTQGKGLPSAYSSQLEKLDQKLNQADPNRPLVQGLKKLWNTPEPPKQDQLNTTEQIESEQLTQRPKLKLGLETDEERLARLTSEKRGDFDATPPVAPEVLKKDRGYNQIGFNSLYMPNAEVKANIQNPLNENNTQNTYQAELKHVTKADAELLAQHGLYLRRNKTTGEILRAEFPTGPSRAKALTQEEIKYINNILEQKQTQPAQNNINQKRQTSPNQINIQQLTRQIKKIPIVTSVNKKK